LAASPVPVAFMRPNLARPAVLLFCVAVAVQATACRRTRGKPAAPNVAAAAADSHNVRCVERPEGCVFCDGVGAPPPMLEPEEPPSSLCDPKDPGNCVDFCSLLAPECATSWFRG